MHVYFRYWLKKTQPSISSCSDRITSYSSFAITYISKMNRIKYTNRWLLNSLFFHRCRLASSLQFWTIQYLHKHIVIGRCVWLNCGALHHFIDISSGAHTYIFFFDVACCKISHTFYLCYFKMLEERRWHTAYTIHTA